MKRLLCFLLLAICLGSAVAKPEYDVYHDFQGNVLCIENNMVLNTTGSNVERVWYDEQGRRIYSEVEHREHKEIYHLRACYDQNCVQAIIKSTTRYVDGEKVLSNDTLRYTVEQRRDYQYDYTHTGTLSFEDIDTKGNWRTLKVDGRKLLTRRIWYYGQVEMSAEVPIRAREQMLDAIKPKEPPKQVSEAEMAVGIAYGLLLRVFSTIIKIVVVLYALLFFFKYDVIKNFFNARAEAKILGSHKVKREELVAAIVGAVIGILQWAEAMAGASFMSELWCGVLIVVAVYLFILRRRLLSIATPKAVRWFILYKLSTILLFLVVGALISIVAVGILVASLFIKGLDSVWKQEFSYANPTDNGSGAVRTCGSCKFWNNGYCSYHDMNTSANGGCGV